MSDYDDLIDQLANGQAPSPFRLKTVLQDLHAASPDVSGLASTVSGHTSTLSSQGSTLTSYGSRITTLENNYTADHSDLVTIKTALLALHII